MPKTEQWAGLLKGIYENKVQLCPACQAGEVKHEFFANEKRLGYAVLYCEKCGQQVRFSRMQFPKTVETIPICDERLTREQAEVFLRSYCEERNIDYAVALSQLHGLGRDCALLCVSNPDAPEADGLANEDETRMLPTLYIRRQPNGFLLAEETPYTAQYLFPK